jgi:hypothetical protein
MPITFLDEEEDIEPIVPPTKRKITFLDEEDDEVMQPAPSFIPYQYDKSRFRPKAKTPEEKEVGTIEGITNAAKNAFDSSRQAMDVIGGVTPEEAKNISKIEYDKQSRKLAPGYDEYQKAEGMDAVWAFAKNPIEVTSNIIAEGLAGSLPALGAGLAAGGVGAAAGSVFPVIGTGVGFTAGQVAGTFAGSLATEYGGKILEEMQNEGMDIQDPESIQKFFSNQTLVDAAKDKALKRGVPIAAFDAISAGIGGKLGRVIGKQFVTKTGEAAAELGVQAGLGGGGEVAGSLVAGDPIEGKAVFGEIIGEAGPGAAEIVTGRIADRQARLKAQADAKVKAASELSTTLEENNAPLTANVIKSQTATSMEQDKLAADLEDQLDAIQTAPKAKPTKAGKLPTDFLPVETPGATYGREEGIYDVFSGIRRKPLDITQPAEPTAQPPITDATQEIIQQEGVRPEPQDGTQVRPTAEAIVSDSLQPPARGEEEGQVIFGLRSVADNTATREQISALSEAGLVDIVKGKPVINEDGAAILAQPAAPAIVEQEPVTTPALEEAVTPAPIAEAPIVSEEGGQVSEITTAPTIGEEPQVSPEIENLIQRAESATTREEASQIGRDFAALDPSLPPPPSAEYDIVKAISDKANRRPYNADALTEENITAAKEAGLVTKTKVPKLTESGRSLVTDGARVARDREIAIGDITDRVTDQTVSAWDAKNDPVSSAFQARIATQQAAPTIAEPAPVEPITPAPVTEQAAPAEAPAPEVAPASDIKSISDSLITGRVGRIYEQANQVSGGRGTSVGSGGVREQIEAASLVEMRKAIADGASLQDAASLAKASSREMIKSHNAKRKGDVNWQINENYSDSQIDRTASDILDVQEGKAEIGAKGYIVSKQTTTPAVSETITEPAAAPAQPTGISVPPIVGEMISAARQSAQEMQSKVSNVKIGPIEGGVETFTFDFDGQTYRGELNGRNRDLVIGASPESDSAIATRVLIDNAATPIQPPAVSETITEPALVEQKPSKPLSVMEQANANFTKKYGMTPDEARNKFLKEKKLTSEKLNKLPLDKQKELFEEYNSWKENLITAQEPVGIAVGNRIKLGKSPQTYTIEEVIPQSANDKKFGEQYYNVKNEKTGETQVVEKNDIKPVKSKGDVRLNPLGYDIADAVEDIKAGKTDTPLRAVNQVIEEATELRNRVATESARRKQPRKMGKAAILERIARERSAGNINEKTAKALTDFINRVNEDAIWDTAISIRAKGVSNFDFGDNLVTFFLNQDKGDLGASVGIHEFWHGLSRFLPDAEVEKINKDYTKELAGYLKENPWFLAFVGRYSLTPEQFEAYKKFNPKEAETKLTPVKDDQGNIVKYNIKFDKDNYRYIMLDEFIAEKMTDLVLGKQQEPNTFLGKLAKVLREFIALIKASSGFDVYEKFYQAVTSTNGKLTLQRQSGVAPAMQIYEPLEYDYSTRRMELQTQDARFAELEARAKAGDKEAEAEAQRMVDEAARAGGYDSENLLFHGTTHIFNVFKKDRANIENDLGKGYYFTNTENDAQVNYAGEGPDLTNRIERLAEQLESNEEIPREEAISKAKEILSGGEQKIINAYLKLDNPFVIGSPNETFLDYNENYDPETEEYGEPSGKLLEFIENFREVASKYDGATPEEGVQKLMEAAIGYDGLGASEIIKILKEDGSGIMYAEDSNGDLASSEIIREAIEATGFDGIVDTLVNQKFGSQKRIGKAMAGMEQGTVHTVAFNSNQIKSSAPFTYDDAGALIPLSERFQSSEPDIRRMAVEAEPRTEQVAGRTDRGTDIITTPVGIIKQTNEVLRKNFFDGTTVSDETTKKAWEYIERSLDIESGKATELAGQINNVVDAETNSKARMGASLFHASLANYAAKLAALGDDTMLSFLVRRINKMPLDNRPGAMSDYARGLRGAREYDIDGYGALKVEQQAKRDRTAAEIFARGNPTEQQVKAVSDAIDAADNATIGTPDEVASDVEQIEKRTKRNITKKLETLLKKGSLKEMIASIKNTPLEEQQSPGWIEKVIKGYLEQAGLTGDAATTAAKLYDSILTERFVAAKQKAFEETLKRSAPWNNYLSRNSRMAKDSLKKIQVAIRTGVLDPSQTIESVIAKENGWDGFTKEQFEKIVQLDNIINNPDNDDVTRREAMSELNKVIVDAKLPVRFKDALGAYYVGNALMGIPTGLVNLVSPAGFAIRNMMTDIGRYAFTDPARIPLAFESFLDSMRSWYDQTSYAFKNQIYLNDVVEYLQGQNVLRELFDKGKKQWANGEYAAGFVNMAVGMTQITGRVLSSLDQGAIAMLENQNITRYAMEALAGNTKGKIPKDKLKEFANMVLHTKRRVIAESVASGMPRDRAGVLADLAVKSEIIAALATTKMGPASVLDAAINDALLSVGRNKAITIKGAEQERKNLRDEGIISFYPIGILEGISEYAGRQGSGMQIFAKMLYGFALVPARVFHNVAWFSPYGFVRLWVDNMKKNKGQDSPYAMSLQTDVQYKQRLTEAIAGSIVMLGLFALRAGSSDDEDDKQFKIVITGNGPSATTDRQYYDSWNKKWKPYSIHIVIGDTIIPINIGRGGEALFFPIMLAGAMDDWEIKKKQNDTKKSPEDLNMMASMLGSSFFALLQRGPYAAFTKQLVDASKDGRVTEELASQVGYFGKTFVPLLGTSVARNITDFINDPVDRSSVEGAIYANTPIVGPWMGAKALNALGQPVRADDWGDKLFKLGVPVVFSFPKNTPMNELNELILKQGSGPTFPTRTNAQKRFGDILTDDEFESYVREYGKVMSDRMFKNRTKLERMKPSDYDDELEKYARGYSAGDFKVKGASDMAVQAVKRMRQ